MASHHQQVTRMKTASEAQWVRSFIVFGKGIWSAVQTLSLFFSAALRAPGRFGHSSWRNDERGKWAGMRAGRPARRTGRLSSSWQCSRIQMDYQSCIRWQELKWDTVPAALSLSSSPHTRSELVGGWNTHTILSDTELWLAHSHPKWQFPLTGPLVAPPPLYISHAPPPFCRKKEWDGGGGRSLWRLLPLSSSPPSSSQRQRQQQDVHHCISQCLQGWCMERTHYPWELVKGDRDDSMMGAIGNARHI